MLAAPTLVELLKQREIRFFTGVPCSCLTPISAAVQADPELRYVGATNEGDAVALAAGAQLAGRRGAVLLQNSGLGNAVNPLSSLTHCCEIPLLLFISLRGDPQGPLDEPQHRLMGRITGALLDQLEIGWELLPPELAAAEAALDRALNETVRPRALIVRPGTLASTPPTRAPGPARFGPAFQLLAREPARAQRHEILRAVQAATAEDLVIATTGYTGRELAALEDRPNQLYMVGSMGCACSLGLGAALSQPRRVVVLDGDGALLMRLGALATAGHERPANLVHLLLDNQCHESTGGQPTVSQTADLAAMAVAAGYPRVERLYEPRAVAAWLNAREPGLAFLHVPVLPGTLDPLPRPDLAPPLVARRVRAFLK